MALHAAIRTHFSTTGALEVETPLLSAAGTVDPNIDSFASGGRWLQTSPEFAMKRLLAAGSGPIFQIAKVFRREEAGRLHQPEFTLLEWYRPGWDYRQLMDEVVRVLLAVGAIEPGPVEQIGYCEAFLRHAGIDPHTATIDALRASVARFLGEPPDAPEPSNAAAVRDFHLDLLMSSAVAPKLGRDRPVFVTDFPASQAALAKVRAGDPPVAERFELFWDGIELANGFSELTDAGEQRRRFEADAARRRASGRPTPPIDENFLAALAQGLPPCAGVALGLDRLLMRMLRLERVADTLAFDWERA